MKRIASILAAAILGTCAAFAQELANFAITRQQLVSPEISGSSVTFRLDADYATMVSLSGNWMEQGVTVPMKKESGVWSVTVDLPSPEIYTYSFIVDGVSLNDPHNYMVQRDGTRYLSMLLVPGDRTADYVSSSHRGNVRYEWYDSAILGGISRRLAVYTPYGYDAKANARKKYPVLYLLHGGGGDEEAWLTMGRAAQILDNLIEQGRAVPMIVVMPNGNPNQQAACTMGMENTSLDFSSQAFSNVFVRSLCEEIIPYVEKNYRVINKPASRAISGLSMGGGHTVQATALYPDKFDYICPLSAGGRVTDQQIQALKKAGVKLFFLACGTSDFVYDMAKEYDEALTRNGLVHTFYQTDGGHTWANWRHYLDTFVPYLFK